jgi:hypothetical protein
MTPPILKMRNLYGLKNFIIEENILNTLKQLFNRDLLKGWAG